MMLLGYLYAYVQVTGIKLQKGKKEQG
jgi:hypothetical protein